MKLFNRTLRLISIKTDPSSQIQRVLSRLQPFSKNFRERVQNSLTPLQQQLQSYQQYKPYFQETKIQAQDLYQFTVKNVIQNDSPSLNESASYYYQIPGKIIRPRLMFIFNQLLSLHLQEKARLKVFNEVKLWASLIQSLHIASLMHDDVIDNGKTRRGLMCHHLKYSKNQALFAGDYIIARAAQKIYQFGNVQMYKVYAQIISELTSGQVLQAQKLIDSQLEALSSNYFSKTYYKTGALISHALRGVIKIHKSQSAKEQLAFNIGVNLGIAFQIIDDILDFIGDPKQMGKPNLNDLAEGIVNLPALFVLVQGEPLQRQIISKAIKSKSLEAPLCQQIKQLVIKHEGCRKARMIAMEHVKTALEQSQQLFGARTQAIKYFCWALMNRKK